MAGNFWANKLGTPQALPQEQTVPQPWWANTTVTPVRTQQMDNHGPVMVDNYSTTRAESAKLTSRCPDCNSGNFFGTTESRPHCFDCGYPVVQRASGDHSPTIRSGNPELAASKQVGDPRASHFNPKHIIGKVG